MDRPLVSNLEKYKHFCRQRLKMTADLITEDRMEVLASFMLLYALEATEEFVEDAVRLKDSKPADRALWQQVCEMGRELAPENPMFAERGSTDCHIGPAGRLPPRDKRAIPDRRVAGAPRNGEEQRKIRRRHQLQSV
jgi:hypothetical protein